MVQTAFERSAQITGAQLDDAARNVISAAGYADRFVHRTGHSITSELHGAGANLDNFETSDDRPILKSTSFSIEPGIYLPGDFGVRSELDVVIDSKRTVVVPSEPLQRAVTLPVVGRISGFREQERERLQLRAFGVGLEERIRVGEHRQQVDDVVLRVVADVQVLVPERRLEGIAEELAHV
jgi:hypothetical protein